MSTEPVDGVYADLLASVWVRDRGKWWSTSLGDESEMTDGNMAGCLVDGSAWRVDLSGPCECYQVVTTHRCPVHGWTSGAYHEH